MSHKEKVEKILSKASEIIVDKPEVLKLCLSCLLAKGHLLIEDRPGVGKTSLLKTLAKLMGLSSQRVQFTNDLLPADIIGTQIFNQKTQSFEFHQGPLFAHFVLADEINRASPKTQSACLQAMAEGRVTVDRESHQLPEPFFLVA
ncbi:MAG: AAA family ATPase, partial [Bdellovibrionales bacterium]|nr:AAA family ATPase [Bdellovibrionales bacterium]NQZ18081.1 AAA family ATPase [Bdellovibrionales bacterium]